MTIRETAEVLEHIAAGVPRRRAEADLGHVLENGGDANDPEDRPIASGDATPKTRARETAG